MKILSIGNFTHGWDGSICDEEHIAQALEGFGHEVQRFPRGSDGEFLTSDFTLIAQWDGYSDEFLARLPRPVVYWAFDHQAQDQTWHNKLIYASDLYLSKRIADYIYPKWQWLSQDFAPVFLDRAPQQMHKDIDILFTGTYLYWAKERNNILKAVDEKYNLTIHSINPDVWKAQGFKNVNGTVMDDALPELIARAKVNLSIDHTLEAGYWSDRNAQIMCCGGFVLFRYVPLSESTFHNDIGYFWDIESCFTSLDYWLENDEDRENLAGYGYEHAQGYLKVNSRVDDLITIVRGIL